MRTIKIRGTEFPKAKDAVEHAAIEGGAAILAGGKYLVVPRGQALRLAIDGVEFAYLVNHEMPDGTFRIVTVPVYD